MDDNPAISMETLAALPQGSLGRAVRDLMQQEGDLAEGLELHDTIHVITGLPTDPAGEEIAVVYDYVLRDQDEYDLGDIKRQVAEFRSRVPLIAERYGRVPPKQYLAACNKEFEAHFKCAQQLRERIKAETGKYFHEMSAEDQLGLSLDLFKETRTEVTRIRQEFSPKQITVEAGHFLDMQRRLGAFLGSSSQNLDIYFGSNIQGPPGWSRS